MIASTTILDNGSSCDSSIYNLCKVLLKFLYLSLKLFLFLQGFCQFGNNQRWFTGWRTWQFTEGRRHVGPVNAAATATAPGLITSSKDAFRMHPPLHVILILLASYLGAWADQTFLHLFLLFVLFVGLAIRQYDISILDCLIVNFTPSMHLCKYWCY
jgi:hypothetical protein